MFSVPFVLATCLSLTVGSPVGTLPEEESTLTVFLAKEVSSLQDQFRDLKGQVIKHATYISQLQTSGSNQKASLNDLQRQVGNHTTNIQLLQSDVMKQNSSIKDVEKELSQSLCQTGTAKFDWPSVILSAGNLRAKSVKVVFTRPFKRTPVISFGLIKLDVYNDRNTRVECVANDVTPTSFELSCDEWANTWIVTAWVSWIAC